MKACVDSSVVLRVLLAQPNRLREWAEIEEAVVSALLEIECVRALDRLRLRGELSDEAFALRRDGLFRFLNQVHVVEMTRPVLVRASQPLPTPLGTLDATHLATVLLAREEGREDLVLATHDGALALAARAFGVPVIGV